METIVGIDFGTTNTIITKFIEPHHFITIKDTIFTKIPSRIGFYNDKIYCGNNIPINDNIIIKENFKLNICDNTELLIIFFKYLYNIINSNNIKAVITIPSNYNDNERETIKKCFEHVNINVIRIINEPSAGALAYGLNQSLDNDDNFLVIDIGGGTTDFSVLEKTDLFFEVIYSYGINNFGGNTITDLIQTHMINNNMITNFNIAQNIKEKLTYLDSISNITKNDLNNLIIENNIFIKFKNILKNIITEYNDIKNIILIGGSSRIPYIQETIKNMIEKNNINLILYNNLEFAVSEGACIYASILLNKYNYNNQLILIDVLPISLGVELSDGTYSIILPKNTPLPAIKKNKYTTNIPGINNISIKVYQGEKKLAINNNLIGEFIFDKISISTNPIIEIIFKVDVNSILTITIIDIKTNIDKNIIIKNLPKINENVDIIINDLENDELQKIQYIYLIKTFISNYISNLNVNNIINDEDKNKMVNYFQNIENKINDLSNLELIEIYDKLEMEFINNISINEDYLEINENVSININIIKNKINNLLVILDVDNIYHINNLKSILENIDYNNEKYINDKLNYINNLNNMIEFKNLCLFLQIEINNNNINNNILKKIVNEKLIFLNDNKDNEIIDWMNELNNFNSICDKIA
jgi:molecular chaperone DnaK